jgi:hypothetical protein
MSKQPSQSRPVGLARDLDCAANHRAPVQPSCQALTSMAAPLYLRFKLSSSPALQLSSYPATQLPSYPAAHLPSLPAPRSSPLLLLPLHDPACGDGCTPCLSRPRPVTRLLAAPRPVSSRAPARTASPSRFDATAPSVTTSVTVVPVWASSASFALPAGATTRPSATRRRPHPAPFCFCLCFCCLSSSPTHPSRLCLLTHTPAASKPSNNRSRTYSVCRELAPPSSNLSPKMPPPPPLLPPARPP